MNSHDQINKDFDLALEVGELKGMMKGIIDRLDYMNGAVAQTTKTINKHDVFLGKIGVIMTTIGVFVSAIITIITRWILDYFFHK